MSLYFPLLPHLPRPFGTSPCPGVRGIRPEEPLWGWGIWLTIRGGWGIWPCFRMSGMWRHFGGKDIWRASLITCRLFVFDFLKSVIIRRGQRFPHRSTKLILVRFSAIQRVTTVPWNAASPIFLAFSRRKCSCDSRKLGPTGNDGFAIGPSLSAGTASSERGTRHEEASCTISEATQEETWQPYESSVQHLIHPKVKSWQNGSFFRRTQASRERWVLKKAGFWVDSITDLGCTRERIEWLCFGFHRASKFESIDAVFAVWRHSGAAWSVDKTTGHNTQCYHRRTPWKCSPDYVYLQNLPLCTNSLESCNPGSFPLPTTPKIDWRSSWFLPVYASSLSRKSTQYINYVQTLNQLAYHVQTLCDFIWVAVDLFK